MLRMYNNKWVRRDFFVDRELRKELFFMLVRGLTGLVPRQL